MTAEDAPIGSNVTWSSPPRVKPAIGSLPFSAPSTTGKVVGLADFNALVQFRYTTPSGRTAHSEPLEVLPGQLCEIVA